MHVNVHHGLPCGCAIVEANVVAVRRALLVEDRFRFIQQCEHCLVFFCSAVKERRDVPAGDDERMPFGQGVAVMFRHRQRMLGEDLPGFDVAEEALFFGGFQLWYSVLRNESLVVCP